MKRLLENLLFGLFLLFISNIASAASINWVSDWSIPQTNHAEGTLMQNGSLVNVTYNGHIAGIAPSSYWSEGSPAPYTGNAIVDNAPTQGITLNAVSTVTGGYANVLTFSLPVINPVFALYSVGQLNVPVSYEFDQSFKLLSEGQGHWGNGSFEINGNTLTGREGHGVIQFIGAISSIAWNLPNAENHHGFAVGAISETSVVPLPASILLFGSGLLGLFGVKKRNNKA